MTSDIETTTGMSRRDALRTGGALGLGLAAAVTVGATRTVAQDGTPAAAAGKATMTRTVLTLDGAMMAVEAARAKAEELGVALVIVVVDESGIQNAFARMDGTGVASIDLSTGKAYTAAAFRTPTADLAERLSQNPAAVASFTSAPGVMLLGGGVPPRVGDTVVGGIGCGGATPEQDAEVAQAGADALAGA